MNELIKNTKSNGKRAAIFYSKILIMRDKQKIHYEKI